MSEPKSRTREQAIAELCNCGAGFVKPMPHDATCPRAAGHDVRPVPVQIGIACYAEREDGQHIVGPGHHCRAVRPGEEVKREG